MKTRISAPVVMLFLALGAFVAGLAFIWWGVPAWLMPTTTPRQTSRSNFELPGTSAHGGDDGYLYAGARAQNVVLAVSRRAMDELGRAHSDREIASLVLAGQCFLVPRGTRVHVIEAAGAITHVRIIGGQLAGDDGWCPYEWVRK